MPARINGQPYSLSSEYFRAYYLRNKGRLHSKAKTARDARMANPKYRRKLRLYQNKIRKGLTKEPTARHRVNQILGHCIERAGGGDRSALRPVIEELILNVSASHCPYCTIKLTLLNISLDHRCPLGRGGTNAADNLQLVCQRCNRAKGTFSHDEFAKLANFRLTDPALWTLLERRLRSASLYFRR